MEEYVFYAIVVLTLFIAIQSWRTALYIAILLDVVRDPVRKLLEGHTVRITQSVSLIWLVVAIVVMFKEGRRIAAMTRRYPSLKTATGVLILALLPGAVVSLTSFDDGWKLALLGGASYMALVPGILIGYAFPRSSSDIRRFMAFYCVVNCVAMISGLAEYLHWNWPALGGIDVVWFRNRPGAIIPLMCGFYRSPDLLGLHAAVVCMFAVVLATTGTKNRRYLWYLAVAWGTAILLIAGRRKMIGIPFVFLGTFAYLTLRRTGKLSQALRYASVGAAIVCFVFLFAVDLGLSESYGEYNSSLFSQEAADRGSVAFSSPLTSLQQSGIFGAGLGTATQGAQLLMGRSITWQEDGSGKLFVELGIFGVVLLASAVVLLIRSGSQAMRSFPGDSTAFRLQAGLMSVVVGNVASFIISHQAYSGDPASICLVLFCLGVVFALPEVLSTARPTVRAQPTSRLLNKRPS